MKGFLAMKDIKKRYIDLINHYDPFCDMREHATLTPSEMLYNLIEIRKNNFDCIESDDIELVNKFDSLIDYMKSKGIEPSIETDLIEDNRNINIEFDEIECIYTGGGIWNFLGKLSNGNYFFASDLNDDFIELDEDPRTTEEYSYWEWLGPHSVHIYNDNETAPIFIELFKWLESHDNNDFDFQAEINERIERL